MIVVTVELKSAYGPNRDKMLGKMIIANDGTGTLNKGNYKYRISKRGKVDHVTFQTSDIWRWGNISDFPRKSLNIWHLMCRCLQDATQKKTSNVPKSKKSS